MYEKYLIVASKLDSAGVNITTQLSQFRQNPLLSVRRHSPDFVATGTEGSLGQQYDFYLRDEEIISNENLNHEKINQYDFIIFVSKHKSEMQEKTLSIHSPGNWRQAEMGGESGKICPTSASFLKQIFQKLKSNTEKYHLENYHVTLECTHHGPLINKPCIFVEIGSTENEWKDRKAGFVIAKTISEMIEEFKENQYNEIAFAIGGPHYCPNFNKIQLNSNIAIGHIIPQYQLPLKEEMVKEALEKTKEEIDLAVLDWKGIKNSEIRKQIIEILDKLYVRYERTSDIVK